MAPHQEHQHQHQHQDTHPHPHPHLQRHLQRHLHHRPVIKTTPRKRQSVLLAIWQFAITPPAQSTAILQTGQQRATTLVALTRAMTGTGTTKGIPAVHNHATQRNSSAPIRRSTTTSRSQVALNEDVSAFTPCCKVRNVVPTNPRKQSNLYTAFAKYRQSRQDRDEKDTQSFGDESQPFPSRFSRNLVSFSETSSHA
ncbi:uncharacterized protein MYCFIDRAFT_86800 [Pseudocercospora fijiensis CIRAD86]|uniref:Uncharacterized protein n=1 Tax=Pseudocercospora fijiensis (strain CIRAD86) TaxID=383855 RepID=M3ARU6_PSEFD|nr:uncharacterized protein MYCFIDRAFT_86800 [Pseudocercospora fijiensis CIRAD86]EME80177.1 hypothetical protein MYCFIDRAFT_86800 [Pseudocercospora fijiensis CIRAD86]